MTLNELNIKLDTLLPSFKDGRWIDASYEHNGKLTLWLVHPDHTHEYESDMSEHDLSVEFLMGLFERNSNQSS